MAAFMLLVCVVSATFSQAVLANSATVAFRPNVLFLVVDDLRPKLGCYGEINMVTPNIDQLAAKSVRFERAYVQQAVCSPSRTSFLTGRRPDTTRIFDLVHYFRHLAGNYTTLPQHFKNNGYVTQSVGKIFHPGSASGGTDDYPYSWTYKAFHAPTEGYTGKKICPSPDGTLTHSAVCPVDLKTVPGGTLPDIQNTDFTIEFLKNRSIDHKPFFVGMGYHRPHLPFDYPKEYLELYPMSKIQLAPNPYYPPWLPEMKLRQSYSAAASFTDAQVGRVLQAWDQYGLADNTIITFRGDHGSLLLIVLCAFANTAMCSPITNPCGASGHSATVDLPLVLQSLQDRADQISSDANSLKEFLTVGTNPWVTDLNKPTKGYHFSGFPYDFQGTFKPHANVTETLIKDYVFLSKLHIVYEQLRIITDCSTRENKHIAQSTIDSVLKNSELALCSIDIYLTKSGHFMPDTQIPTRAQVLDDTRIKTDAPDAPDFSKFTDRNVPFFTFRSAVTYIIARDTETTCTSLAEQYKKALS